MPHVVHCRLARKKPKMQLVEEEPPPGRERAKKGCEECRVEPVSALEPCCSKNHLLSFGKFRTVCGPAASWNAAQHAANLLYPHMRTAAKEVPRDAVRKVQLIPCQVAPRNGWAGFGITGRKSCPAGVLAVPYDRKPPYVVNMGGPHILAIGKPNVCLLVAELLLATPESLITRSPSPSTNDSVPRHVSTISFKDLCVSRHLVPKHLRHKLLTRMELLLGPETK